MEADEFEGSLILERLAELGRLEEFAALVDADDLVAVASLLTGSGFDVETVARVIEMIKTGED